MPTATGTFTVPEFVPVDYESPVVTAVSTGHAHMRKEFSGAVAGRSATQFSYAFDQATGVGTYVAMEAFEGSIDGLSGACNIAHTATTHGTDRVHELVVIVPGSGTEALRGITGSGAIVIDADGTHVLRLDYTIEPDSSPAADPGARAGR